MLDATIRRIAASPLERLADAMANIGGDRWKGNFGVRIVNTRESIHQYVNNPTGTHSDFGNYGINNGLSSHHTGGAIMGADPKTSVINRYLQCWDASNLFVMGGAAFPQNAGHNPTGTIGALTYWSAQAIISQYLKSPRQLVPV